MDGTPLLSFSPGLDAGAETGRAVGAVDGVALAGTLPEDAPLSAEIEAVRSALAAVKSAGTEGEAIDRIRALEELKATCAAVQAREAVALDSLRVAREAENGVPVARRGRGVGAEVALARREAAHRGGRHLGLARALCHEMPHTLRALTNGEIPEEHATVMVRETAWLPVAHRRSVDELMTGRLGRIGVKKLAAEARAHAQRLDQASAVAHLERSKHERRVSVRPTAGGMAYLTALLPMPQAVAVYANLHRDASTAVGVGDVDGRTRDQVMADLLVERATGQAAAAAVPTEIHLVMTTESLFAAGDTPTWMPGQGPIPAAQARELVADPAGEVFLRRLFTAPETGQLVSMDSRSRVFPPMLRRLITLRDDVCRTPWCEAPIRHADHARPHRDGGPTSFENGSGLCTQCNLTKENAGWRHQATAAGLDVTTPTGHRYRQETAPPAVWNTGPPTPRTARSPEQVGADVQVEAPPPTPPFAPGWSSRRVETERDAVALAAGLFLARRASTLSAAVTLAA